MKRHMQEQEKKLKEAIDCLQAYHEQYNATLKASEWLNEAIGWVKEVLSELETERKRFVQK